MKGSLQPLRVVEREIGQSAHLGERLLLLKTALVPFSSSTLPAQANIVSTMSSREIAELTGKRHDHVIRDIEKMLDDVSLDHPNFGGVYVDAKGEQRKCYNLPKNLTLNLIAGYRAAIRLKIIDRWLEMEKAKAAQLTPP